MFANYSFSERRFSILAALAMAMSFCCQVEARGAAAVGQTFDVVIGRMCIGGMPRSARHVTGQIQNGSDVYEDWTLSWHSSRGEAAPVIRFLKGDKAVDSAASCRELTNDVVFDGDIESIRVKARSSAPGNRGAARIAIADKGLEVVIGHVKSGLASLFGGELKLAGSKAWIKSHGAILVVADAPSEGSCHSACKSAPLIGVIGVQN